jgi:glycosyltransferase 2 family protein
MSRAQRIAIGVVVSIAGISLLVWQVRSAGPAAIKASLLQVGWGFLAILAVSFLRFTLRSLAWTTLMDAPRTLSAAVAATLAGDAIGNVTPLSLLVSEPAKSMYLRDRLPASRSFSALTAENFFYTISVALFIVLGTGAMLQAFDLREELRLAGLIALTLMISVLVGALWIGWRQPALLSALVERLPTRTAAGLIDRVRRFEATTYGVLRHSARPGRVLAIVVACEALFHVLSFAEAYFTIWLITGRSEPLAAFVLDTFNRVVNVVFRAVPMRVGVDEASTALVAPAVGLDPAVGVTIALVRKGRMLVWAGIGIALAISKGLTLKDVMAPDPSVTQTPGP